MTPNQIESAAMVNDDARHRLAEMITVMGRLVGKVLRDAEDGADGVDDLVSEAAVEAMEVMLAKPICGASPPWPPPRYKLPDDRTGVNGSLRMGEGEKLDLTAWVSFYADGNPAEIFVEKSGDQSFVAVLLDALAVAVSIGLQYGVPWEVFAAKLKGWRFPPDGITDDTDTELRMVASPLDYLFKWADKQIHKRAKSA